MKKSILIMVTIILSTNLLNSQVTFDTSIPGGISLIKLHNNGFKYKQYGANVITLYNLNNTVYKTINIPTQSVAPNSVGYISENLFDLDNNIEFAVYYLTNGAPTTKGYFYIYNEDGSTLFYENSVSLTQPISVTVPNIFDNTQIVYYTSSGAKLKLNMENGNTNIYNIPGTLLCNDCSSNIVSYVSNPNSSTNPTFETYPNPSSDFTKIKYTLPDNVNKGEIIIYDIYGKEIKKYSVTNTFDNITLSNEDLPSGTYLYLLKANNYSSTKKVIVIK